MEDADFDDEDDDELTKAKTSFHDLDSPTGIQDSSVQQVLELIMEENNDANKSGRRSNSSRSGLSTVITADLELGDAEMSLVEEVDLEGGSSLEGQAIQLDDGSTAFVEPLSPDDIDDPNHFEHDSQKFTNGQAVQLEDGTTAFLHMSPGEGLQAVQLEDGTTAYISLSPPSNILGGSIFLENDTKQIIDNNIINGSMKNTSSARALALGTKAFKCSFSSCSKVYTTQHHLKVHERSHTGDRPYHCPESSCGKTFTTSYSLKSHIRVHTGETPYHCPEDLCPKAFKTSGDLQKHIRTHTGERPFTCPFEGCDRSFTTSNIRKVHIRTHTGERPYICQVEGCGRAFASATNYKNHQRIHTGEKPYMCSVPGCRRRFTEYSSLYKHHVVHTVAKPYTCNLCGRNYRQTSTLAMHKRSSHGITDLANSLCEEPSLVEPSVSLTADEESVALNNRGIESRKCKEEVNSVQDDASICVSQNLVLNSTSQASQISLLMSSFTGKPSETAILTLRPPVDVNSSTKILANKDGSTYPAQTQQILLLTDPSQLAVLQQLAQQAKLGQFQATTTIDLQSILKSNRNSSIKNEETNVKTEGNGES